MMFELYNDINVSINYILLLKRLDINFIKRGNSRINVQQIVLRGSYLKKMQMH